MVLVCPSHDSLGGFVLWALDFRLDRGLAHASAFFEKVMCDHRTWQQLNVNRCARRYVGHNSQLLVPLTLWPGGSLAARESQTLAGVVWAKAMEDGGFCGA